MLAMEKYGDLRFIIGTFFSLVGLLLLLMAWLTHSEKSWGTPLNAWSGAGMLLFGAFMLWLHRRG